MLRPTDSFVQQNRDRLLDELKTFLRIPSISTLPEHKKDVEAAAWVACQEVPWHFRIRSVSTPFLRGKEGPPLVSFRIVLIAARPRFAADFRHRKVIGRTPADEEEDVGSRFEILPGILRLKCDLPKIGGALLLVRS